MSESEFDYLKIEGPSGEYRRHSDFFRESHEHWDRATVTKRLERLRESEGLDCPVQELIAELPDYVSIHDLFEFEIEERQAKSEGQEYEGSDNRELKRELYALTAHLGGEVWDAAEPKLQRFVEPGTNEMLPLIFDDGIFVNFPRDHVEKMAREHPLQIAAALQLVTAEGVRQNLHSFFEPYVTWRKSEQAEGKKVLDFDTSTLDKNQQIMFLIDEMIRRSDYRPQDHVVRMGMDRIKTMYKFDSLLAKHEPMQNMPYNVSPVEEPIENMYLSGFENGARVSWDILRHIPRIHLEYLDDPISPEEYQTIARNTQLTTWELSSMHLMHSLDTFLRHLEEEPKKDGVLPVMRSLDAWDFTLGNDANGNMRMLVDESLQDRLTRDPETLQRIGRTRGERIGCPMRLVYVEHDGRKESVITLMYKYNLKLAERFIKPNLEKYNEQLEQLYG